MANCQFCNAAGSYMPAEVMGPPYAAASGVEGLKLVTCDFHPYHCAFFVCATCWSKDFHLCKEPHPGWAGRINNWQAPSVVQDNRLSPWQAPSGDKTESIKERWRYRYVDKQKKRYPAVCRRGLFAFKRCNVCGNTGGFFDAVKRCTNKNCKGLLFAPCPACIETDVKSSPSPLIAPCHLSVTTATSSLELQAPEQSYMEGVDLDPFARLPIRYMHKQFYAKLKILDDDAGAAKVLIAPDLDESGAGAWSETGQIPPEDQWRRYVATNLIFNRSGELLANAIVLLPEPVFTTARNTPRPVADRPTRSATSSVKQQTNEKFSKGVLIFRAVGCRVFQLSDEEAKICLEVPQAGLKERPIRIIAPRRVGGGGGATARANDVGSSMIRHLVRSPSSSVEWLACAVFFAAAKAGETLSEADDEDSVEALQGKPLGDYRLLRTLHGSESELYMSFPKNPLKRQKIRAINSDEVNPYVQLGSVVDSSMAPSSFGGGSQSDLDKPRDSSSSEKKRKREELLDDFDDEQLPMVGSSDGTDGSDGRGASWTYSTVPPTAYSHDLPHTASFWNWNGRPLEMMGSVAETWKALTREKLEKREYKDTHLFVMKIPSLSRQEDEREQDTFFDGISATEVITGRSNKTVALQARLGEHAPDHNPLKPVAAYEWSHLIGDGEGGGIHRSNVIASSRANNTEMLVIESILQDYWKKVHEAGLEILIRVEATLHPRLDSLETRSFFDSEFRLTPYLSHIGDWMRYRVWLRQQNSDTTPDVPLKELLVLDHIMDCQRRFISKDTVRFFSLQVKAALKGALAGF